jgi:Ca2+-transporting ATPase
MNKTAGELGETKWHNIGIPEALKILSVDPERGLSPEEVARRRKLYGLNVLAPGKGKSAWLRFLLQFNQPFVYILVIAALIMALLKEWVDSSVFFGAALFNSSVGFLRESIMMRASRKNSLK